MFFYGFGEGHYMMVLSNADASSDIKINLDRQVRARLMAEAAALAQSRELARANAELQTANGNLEQFAEIITHDLKAPMRALNHMADAVEAALDAHDEAAARHKLGELRLQATRMSSMLSALLQYASSGLPGGAIETVDTAALDRGDRPVAAARRHRDADRRRLADDRYFPGALGPHATQPHPEFDQAS